MGQFLTRAYRDGQWHSGDGPSGSPFLRIDIHDSDIATIDYWPTAAAATGRCYLGFEPRHYFEDPAASSPVDVTAEAAGLAHWAEDVRGVEVDAGVLRELLADPNGQDPRASFVEASLAELLNLLGVPLPEDLDGLDEGEASTAPGDEASAAMHERALNELGLTSVSPDRIGDYMEIRSRMERGD